MSAREYSSRRAAAAKECAQGVNPQRNARLASSALGKKMNEFETVFWTVFWGKKLGRINAVSKKLQQEGAHINQVITLYDGLISYIVTTIQPMWRMRLLYSTSPSEQEQVVARGERNDFSTNATRTAVNPTVKIDSGRESSLRLSIDWSSGSK